MLVSESPKPNVHPVPVLLDSQVTTVDTERVRVIAVDNVRVAIPLNELDRECFSSDWDSSYGNYWNTENDVDVHTTVSTSYLKRPNEDSEYEDSDYEDSDYERGKMGN